MFIVNIINLEQDHLPAEVCEPVLWALGLSAKGISCANAWLEKHLGEAGDL